MKKKAYIAPEFTMVVLNNKPLLNFTSGLGNQESVGSAALSKGGGNYWDDDEPEEVGW